MRLIALLLMAVLAAPVSAQRAQNAPAGVVRVLDKITGSLTDLDLRAGQTQDLGLIAVTLDECRYPRNNPSGDAYAKITLRYRGGSDPIFSGWMIASAPALNPLDHPRFDVWVLRCSTS